MPPDANGNAPSGEGGAHEPSGDQLAGRVDVDHSPRGGFPLLWAWRRRQAALRLPPLRDGRRDPLQRWPSDAPDEDYRGAKR